MTKLFSNINIEHIISSPYKRAIDTIAGIAINKGLNIITDSNLSERHITDGYIEDFNGFTARQWQDRDFKFHNGESLNEVQKRAIKATEDILKTNMGKSVVIGTHGTFLATILNYYDPSFAYEQWQKMSMPSVYKIVFDDTNFKSYEVSNI